MSLKRDVRKAIERGSSTYGIVDEVNASLVTVTVVGTGSKVTNLNYLGNVAPKTGDLVILDYSAGPKPLVRLVENQTIFPEDPSMFVAEPNIPGPQDNDGIYGGLDVGMGCTTKAFSNSFPNEPHEQGQPWLQYWGFNLNGTWISALYDTDEIYGSLIYTGPQHFNINLNGKYLIALHTAPHLAGSSYGASPYGILRARILRYYAGEEYPIMIGVATASGYNDYYYMDIAKQIYLSEGDVLSIEFMYTGEVYGYKQSLSSNPLKWLTTGNEFVFKIQLLAEATVSEPPPEIETYEGIARNYSPFGYAITGSDFEGTAEEVNTLNVEGIRIGEDALPDRVDPTGFLGPVYDGQHYYFVSKWGTDSSTYPNGVLWRIAQSGEANNHVLTSGSDDNTIIDVAVLSPGKVVYTRRDPDDTWPSSYWTDYYTLWEDGSTSVFDSHNRDKNANTPIPRWEWERGIWGTAEWDGTSYALALAFRYNYVSEAFGYYSDQHKYRVYDVDAGTYTDVVWDHLGDEGAYFSRSGGQLTELIQIGSKVIGFFDGNVFEDNVYWVHVLDLSTMSLKTVNLDSLIGDPNNQSFFGSAVADRLGNRVYFSLNNTVGGSEPNIGLCYYDLDNDSFAHVGSDGTYRLRFATDSQHIYWNGNDINGAGTYPESEWYKIGSSDVIDIQDGTTYEGSRHLDREEERIWRMDWDDMFLYGYQPGVSSPRAIDVSSTPMDDLPQGSDYYYYNFTKVHLLLGHFFIVGKYRYNPTSEETQFCFIIKKN